MHEGPARISKLGGAVLKRGMIISNEPGYYRTGAYGIRIENLILVTEAPPAPDAEKPLNAFETLTLAPIDQRLIEPAMLTDDEIGWIDSYHARVRDALTPLLDVPTRAWLGAATLTLNPHLALLVPRWNFYRQRAFFPRRVGMERGNVMLGTILIVILILLLLGALPTWPYSTGWGYYPGGGLGLILIIVVILVLVGRI